MLKISLHAYSSAEQVDLQARMAQLVRKCNGSAIDQKTLSPAACRLRFEVALSKIVELYAALQQAGLQFTPLAHRALTEMCVCRKHLPNCGDVQIVSIDLYLGTLDEEHVHFRRFVRINPV